MGGSGEKPDPAEEGEDDEERGGGGRGDDEGEGDHGGCCQLNQWLDAVGDSPLTLGHPLLVEGWDLVRSIVIWFSFSDQYCMRVNFYCKKHR